MDLRRFKDRILALPWVYDRVRPLVVGGLDLRDLGRFCTITKADRVFDLGCGTAQMLDHFSCAKYVGVDLDPVALEKAARRATGHVRFIRGDDWDGAYRELRPTVVLMIGVVHHLSDGEFAAIIRRLRASGETVDRLVAIDVTYFQGRHFNNLLSTLDRGRHVRAMDAYERLYDECGLKIMRREILPTRAGFVAYVGYHLGISGPRP